VGVGRLGQCPPHASRAIRWGRAFLRASREEAEAAGDLQVGIRGVDARIDHAHADADHTTQVGHGHAMMFLGPWRPERIIMRKDQTMTDATTQQPLRVSTDGTAGPYIMVPVSQIDEVKRLLNDHCIRNWVDENAISVDGGPYISVINLGREGNAQAVQAILDNAL
jgi:hypothetical protein